MFNCYDKYNRTLSFYKKILNHINFCITHIKLEIVSKTTQIYFSITLISLIDETKSYFTLKFLKHLQQSSFSKPACHHPATLHYKIHSFQQAFLEVTLPGSCIFHNNSACFCAIHILWTNFQKHFQNIYYWGLCSIDLNGGWHSFLEKRSSAKYLKYCFTTFLVNCLFLTHLMPMFRFFTPWKCHKTRGFLTFSGGIEMEHWPEIGWWLIYLLGKEQFIFSWESIFWYSKKFHISIKHLICST